MLDVSARRRVPGKDLRHTEPERSSILDRGEVGRGREEVRRDAQRRGVGLRSMILAILTTLCGWGLCSLHLCWRGCWYTVLHVLVW